MEEADALYWCQLPSAVRGGRVGATKSGAKKGRGREATLGYELVLGKGKGKITKLLL